MLDNILIVLSEMIQNNLWLAPLIVLIGGILTSLTPCALSSIPLVVGYIGFITDTEESNTKEMFKVSLVFALGQALTFTGLGISAILLGRIMGSANKLWYLFIGVLMILMSLQTLEIFSFINPLKVNTKNAKKGYIGAFLTGTVGGIFASPCATPVLIALISIISNSDNLIWGAFLMLIYAIGVNILVILGGTFTGIVNRIINSKKYGFYSELLKYLLGGAILLVGFYMIYKGL